MFVAEVIRGNPTLNHLSLALNRLDDDMAVADFAEALSKHPSSSNITLILCDNGLGGNAEAFSTILGACANTYCITVKHNNLGSQSAVAVSGFIAMNHPVRKNDILQQQQFQ